MQDSQIIFSKVGPLNDNFEPKTEILKKGWQKKETSLPLPCDILFEQDVEITMRDGIHLYADVFRPVSDQPVPAIISWSPYGKKYNDFPLSVQLSDLQKFEGADPAFWVDHGYAVINIDLRGTNYSGGRIHTWGPTQSKDGADTVEEIAALPWCNGKVAFSGTSYLAISQWFIAAEHPEHLACIAPWEGFSDVYRHSICPGGIPEVEFERIMTKQNFHSNEEGEDMVKTLDLYPYHTEYWDEKTADLASINVPAYVVASYTNKVHARGTLESYEQLGSADKWLRIHNTHEWFDYYTNQEDLCKFFDHYMKGIENGWEETPRVRMSVLDPGGEDIVDRVEEHFPPERTRVERLYLDAAGATTDSVSAEESTADAGSSMMTDPVTEESSISYVSDDNEGMAVFTYRFEKDLEFAGYQNLRIYAECPDTDDMDIFVRAKKLDKDGNELPVLISGAPFALDGKAPVEWGCGRLRASLRQVDEAASTETNVKHTYKNPKKVAPGTVVALDIKLCPMAMRFHVGEQLRLEITGYNQVKPELPFLPPTATINKRMHILHTGGQYQSYLSLPVTEGAL